MLLNNRHMHCIIYILNGKYIYFFLKMCDEMDVEIYLYLRDYGPSGDVLIIVLIRSPTSITCTCTRTVPHGASTIYLCLFVLIVLIQVQ